MYTARYGNMRIELNAESGDVTIYHRHASWHMRSISGSFARVHVNLPDNPGSTAPQQEVLALGGISNTRLQWKVVRGRQLVGICTIPEHELTITLRYDITGSNRVRCTADIQGKGVPKTAEIFFPTGGNVRNTADRLVLPQWLGLLVSPEGDDIYVRRTAWLRPWCMRFIGATQQTPQGDVSYCAIVNDSLHRNVDIRREKGTLDFMYLGVPSYPEKHSQQRTQSLEFHFMEGNYVQIAQCYKKWVMTQPSWRTFASRIRPCREIAVGGAQLFFHIPCDYGWSPMRFEDLIPRIKALKEAGIERGIFHIGGWNRKGYDSQYPDILPANATCGGDEGMRKLTQAFADAGYICAPHDDLGINSVQAPSYNEKFMFHYADGSLVNGGVYREAQNYMASGEGQAHFAKRNVPEVKRRFPAVNGYLYDVTTSVQPLEDYTHTPPTSMEQDLKNRNEIFRITREAFAEFTIGESIVDWSIPYNDCGMMAEEGYIHRGDGGWSQDKLYGEIVPMWELVYHESQIGLRDNTTHVNTPMETEQPLLRYLRVLLKTWRAGTLPPAFQMDNLSLNVVTAMVQDEKNQPQPGWSELDATQLLVTATRVSTWLADNVFHSPMDTHEFADDSLYREHTSFGSRKGKTDVYINTGTTNWSPMPGLMLPPNGFWITGPGMLAYHALQIGGKTLKVASLAAFRWVGNSPRSIKAFRAFGQTNVPWVNGRSIVGIDIPERCKTVTVRI